MKFGKSTLAAGLLLGGCAVGDVSPQQLSQDLAIAEAKQCLTPPTLVKRMYCLDAIDHTIWQRDAPGTLDLYGVWNQKRSAAAARYDSGTLSGDGFNTTIKTANAELWAQVATRGQYTAQQSQENAATLAIMGTAFLNGYNNANAAAAAQAPVMTTCTRNGVMVNCLSN